MNLFIPNKGSIPVGTDREGGKERVRVRLSSHVGLLTYTLPDLPQGTPPLNLLVEDALL